VREIELELEPAFVLLVREREGVDRHAEVLQCGQHGRSLPPSLEVDDETAAVRALTADIENLIAQLPPGAGQARAMTAIADVRSAAQIAQVVARALGEFGRIDILVNNAGAPGSLDRTPVIELPEEAWDTVLDTNLKGTFLTSQAVARTMLERGVRGRIISMSSQWGKKGGARRAAYCASKFGIIGFTQSLAQELAHAGITVNAICPSAADTERLDHLGLRADGTFDPRQREERIKQSAAATPLGRIARPSDVAEVAAFLAGDAAEYITGQSINVTGGGVMIDAP